MYPPSLWMDGIEPMFEPLRENIRCDVAVIGGGIAGLSAAWHLGNQGSSVVLLEKELFGGGSTGRSGGFLAQSSAYDLAELQELYGAEHGLEIYRSVLEGLRSIADVIAGHNIACNFTRAGAFYVAPEPSHREHIEREYTALRSAGFEATLLEPRDFPVAGASAVLRTPSDASVNPSRLARSLAAAMPASVRRFERTEATALEHRGSVQRVRTSSGNTVTTDHVVLATGGWALASHMRGLAAPFTSTIAVTKPLPEDATRALKDSILWDSHEIYHYIRRTPDNRLLIGGNDSVRSSMGFAGDSTTARMLMRTLNRYFPRIEPEADTVWSGVIALPADGLPLIETRGARTLLITDGLLLGWLLGRMTADRIRTGRSDYDHLYDAGRDMGFAGNLLRSIPAPRAAKIQIMRLGLAWNLWRTFVIEHLHR